MGAVPTGLIAVLLTTQGTSWGGRSRSEMSLRLACCLGPRGVQAQPHRALPGRGNEVVGQKRPSCRSPRRSPAGDAIELVLAATVEGVPQCVADDLQALTRKSRRNRCRWVLRHLRGSAADAL